MSTIITLTTDFGLRDHFAGALKGKVLTEYPQAQIVDISHQIDPFNTAEAGYIIESAYSSFPKGSVHLIGVDAELNRHQKHLAMLWNGHYFVCADNDTLGFLTQKSKADKIVSITIHENLGENADDLDALVNVACHLAKGGELDAIGHEISEVRESLQKKAVIASDASNIKGNVIFVDHYGNCVTNISKKMFAETSRDRNYEIVFRLGQSPIRTIYAKYSDVITSDNFTPSFYEGQKLAVFNSSGNLEIAVYRSNPKTTGDATSLLGLKYWDDVIINFL